jgi:DNA polymerase I-like protein with 3'-5' exonuclease and polymerase domains|tara:strand:+ start:249 stop:2090 length:1842 start_codon:yes stop_codon:yes gene_type:complete
MFAPQTEWVMPDGLKDLIGYKEIAIDLETNDPGLITSGSGSVVGRGHIAGIAVAVEGWSGYYPIQHENGGNIDKKLVFGWLQEILNQENTTFIFHNAMYDVCWLRAAGLIIKGKIVDTMIAASLVNENRFKFDLNSLAKEYVGIGKDENVLRIAAKDFGVDPKAEMWRMPAMYVGEYAERDAEVTLKLWQRLSIELHNEELMDIFNLETKLFPCLVDMRFKGVRVDLEHAAKLKKNLIIREDKILKNIKDLVGFDIEINAARSIAKGFDKLKLPYDRTEKSNEPSFTKNFLQNHPHPLPKAIADAREINKARTTFIDSITKHSSKGRIHADINQIRSDQGGTVTGRFSMSNPNLQQIPARHPELGPMIRSIFIPEEKCKWGTFDYSQQEPRILVHYAKLQNLEGVDEIVDAYNEGDADFHQVVADMAGIERKQAKTINLGLMYGMGKNKLMSELGLQKEAAEKLIKQYHAKAPFVKQLMDNVTRKAENRGKIRTLGGRACHFNFWTPTQFGVFTPLPLEQARKEYDEPLKRAFTYKALNKLIQGSAADMTKKSMVALYENGIIPHIQIHDEVDISIESPEQAEKIIEIMESAVTLKVPNKVDYESGKNWGEIK